MAEEAKPTRSVQRSPFSMERKRREEQEERRETGSDSRREAAHRSHRSESSRSEQKESKDRRRRSPTRRDRRSDRDRRGSDRSRPRSHRASDSRKAEEGDRKTQDPDKPPCEHCGTPLTKHLAGRRQHQWTSKNCLAWQFFNMMSKEEQQKPEAWQRAEKDARGVHKKRMEQGGQAPRSAADPPEEQRGKATSAKDPTGVRPPSRSLRRRRRRSPVVLREKEAEWSEVEEEPVPIRSVAPASSRMRGMPPPEPPMPPRSHAPPRVADADPGESKAPKQLTINITL
eukprot:s238_g20.t1